MAYSITRGLKIKDRTQMTSMAEHNFRIRTQENIDSSRTPQNRLLVNKLGVNTSIANDLNKKVTEYYKEKEVKERVDNVLMLEFIATASPEFFKGKSKKQIDEWADAQIDFFEKEFGDNFKIAVLHMDELTPHIHLAITTEEKKIRRFKNRHGESFKEGYSLNANRWNPEYFTGLQTRFSAANERFGLERGVKNSKAKHQTLLEANEKLKAKDKKNVEVINGARKALIDAKAMINGLIDDLVSMIDIVTAKDLDDEEQAEVARVAQRMPTKNRNINKSKRNA